MRRTFVISAVITCVVILAGCGSDNPGAQPYFRVQTEYFAASVNYIEGGVGVSGFTGVPLPPGSNYVTAFQTNTGSDGRYKVDNAYVPVLWSFTRFRSPNCPTTNSGQGTVQNTSIVHLSCNAAVRVFTVDPTSMDAFTHPDTLTISGSGISSQYGMPRIDWYDGNGNIFASPYAQSVASDGSSLVVSTPNLSQEYTGEYQMVISNIQSGGSLIAIGAAQMQITGNDPPPPDLCQVNRLYC